MRSRWLGCSSLVALLAHCGPPTMSAPAEYASQPISAEAGKTYFEETGGGDPYATGMAYPVFLALMDLFPEELGKNWQELSSKFGMVSRPGREGDPWAMPIGFHATTDPNTGVPFLVGNCQLCHAERIRTAKGDVVVSGLGNARARIHAYDNALVRIGESVKLTTDALEEPALRHARRLGLGWPGHLRSAVLAATVTGLRARSALRGPHVRRFDGALPGRMATIESFALGTAYVTGHPIAPTKVIGWARVPDVRGTPFRETLSFDASGFGSPQALVQEADFLFGVRPEWVRSHLHIGTSMLLYLRSFTRTLPFPGAIDRARADRGHGVFDDHCARCHGYYVRHADEMRVSYKERIVPIEEVGTDSARADAVTPDFVRAANSIALVDGLTRVRHTGGYVPPVLLDVWARGIFGHVGQWPSLEVLATEPAARPTRYVVDTEGLYDLERVGVRYDVARAAVPRANGYVYDGTQPGLGVGGHPFLSSLPADDRRDVIEYLKTL